MAKVSVEDSSLMQYCNSNDESKSESSDDESMIESSDDETGDLKIVDVPSAAAPHMSRRQMKKIMKKIRKSNWKKHARLHRKVHKEKEKYEAIVPPEGFSINIVNGVCLDSLIPSEVKSKYSKICAYHGGEKIHSNIHAGVPPEEVVEAIKKVVRLVEEIRNVTLFVTPPTLNTWIGEIHMLQQIGLDLSFMEEHVMELRSILCRHKDECECECESLMDQVANACDDLRRSREVLKQLDEDRMLKCRGEMMRVEFHDMQYIERVGVRLNKFGVILRKPL